MNNNGCHQLPPAASAPARIPGLPVHQGAAWKPAPILCIVRPYCPAPVSSATSGGPRFSPGARVIMPMGACSQRQPLLLMPSANHPHQPLPPPSGAPTAAPLMSAQRPAPARRIYVPLSAVRFATPTVSAPRFSAPSATAPPSLPAQAVAAPMAGARFSTPPVPTGSRAAGPVLVLAAPNTGCLPTMPVPPMSVPPMPVPPMPSAPPPPLEPSAPPAWDFPDSSAEHPEQQPGPPAAGQTVTCSPSSSEKHRWLLELLQCRCCRDFATLHPGDPSSDSPTAGSEDNNDLLVCERCQETVSLAERLGSHEQLPRTVAGLRMLLKGEHSSGETKQPYQMVKVYDIDDLSTGCQVAFRRQLGYFHHAVVTKVRAECFVTVEYDSRLHGNGLARVLEQTRQFGKELPCLYRVDYHSLDCYSPDAVVARARRRLRDARPYSLTRSNCEHLAVWAKTGTSECFQLRELERRFGVGGGAGSVGEAIRILDPELAEARQDKELPISV